MKINARVLLTTAWNSPDQYHESNQPNLASNTNFTIDQSIVSTVRNQRKMIKCDKIARVLVVCDDCHVLHH